MFFDGSIPKDVKRARDALRGKQRRFCEELMVDEIDYKAYKRAKYKVKSDTVARVCACKLLTNANVKIYIQWMRQQRAKYLQKKGILSYEYIVGTIIENLKRSLQHKPVLKKDGSPLLVSTPEGKLAAVYRYNPNAVNKALDMLAKIEQLYIQKIEVEDKREKMPTREEMQQWLEENVFD